MKKQRVLANLWKVRQTAQPMKAGEIQHSTVFFGCMKIAEYFVCVSFQVCHGCMKIAEYSVCVSFQVRHGCMKTAEHCRSVRQSEHLLHTELQLISTNQWLFLYLRLFFLCQEPIILVPNLCASCRHTYSINSTSCINSSWAVTQR